MVGDRRRRRRLRDAVVWGAVGALTFGVLYEGYGILGGGFDWRVLLAGMGVVGAITIAAVPPLHRRLYPAPEAED